MASSPPRFLRLVRLQHGFTLVELSIVLVIIGLLIGGILAAKSMVETSKLNRLMSDVNQYTIAVRNFKTSYNYLPGDYPNMSGNCATGSTISCAGDGDGAISYRWFEPYLAWKHLAMAGMAPKLSASPYTGFPSWAVAPPYASVAAMVGIDMPEVWNKGTTLVFSNETGFGSTCSLFFWISKAGSYSGSVEPNKPWRPYGGGPADFGVPPLTVEQMLAIDKKYDDGVASTGGVMAVLSNLGCTMAWNGSAVSYTASQLSSQIAACFPVICLNRQGDL